MKPSSILWTILIGSLVIYGCVVSTVFYMFICLLMYFLISFYIILDMISFMSEGFSMFKFSITKTIYKFNKGFNSLFKDKP